MGSFDSKIDEVKSRIDIVELISRYKIELKRSGTRWVAKCPFKFHEDRTPSFTVYSETQSFYCFGCGEAGDVINFMMKIEGMPFRDAFDRLAKEAGVVELTEDDYQGITKTRDTRAILKAATEFYRQNIPQDVLTYLQGRGLTLETVTEKKIGYGRPGLGKHLLEQGFPQDLCIGAGVLREDGADHLLGRIIFPYLERGEITQMRGRDRSENDQFKYLSLRGIAIRPYNRDAVSLSEEIFLTEGEIDSLTLVQHGYSAVGIPGATAFQQEWVSLFKRKKVMIVADNDKAGRDGALRTARMLHAGGIETKLIELPREADNKKVDVNDFFVKMKRSKEDFQVLLERGRDFVQFQIDQIPAEAEGQELINHLGLILADIATCNPILQDNYVECLVERFDLSKASLREMLKEASKRNATEISQTERAGRREDRNVVYKANFEGLVDIVEQDGQPAFLIKEAGKPQVLFEVEHEGSTLVPPPRDQMPWMLPRAEEVLKYHKLLDKHTSEELDRVLFHDLIAYHREASELPDEELYTVLAAWEMHSHLPEYCDYSPILSFYAVAERGKTRTGNAIIYVARRGIHTETLNEANIFRWSEDSGATLFIDATDVWNKAEKRGSEDILLNRFEKGATVGRVLWPEKGAFQDMRYFLIFGLTVIATNEPIHHILDTRCIPITMQETTKRFDKVVTRIQALPLQERLVEFRLRHLGELLPAVGKPCPGRLGDILKPLLQMIRLAVPDKEEDFLRFTATVEKGRKLDKSDSLEAQIIGIIDLLRNSVDHGFLPVQTILDVFNVGKPENQKWLPARMGQKLKALGFSKGRKGRSGSSAIAYDQSQIDRLKTSYGVDNPSETSETSYPSPSLVDGSEGSDGSEDQHLGIEGAQK